MAKQGIFRSMIHTHSAPPKPALTLVQELRIASLPSPPPDVDQALLHENLDELIRLCFEDAKPGVTAITPYVPEPDGWCGWSPSPEVVNEWRSDEIEWGRRLHLWRISASAETRARAAVQILALRNELRLRGLRAHIEDEIFIRIQWGKPWWERLMSGILFTGPL